jgi:Protein of unknown function (DUF1559)
MAQFSIRRMMVAIALVAVVLGFMVSDMKEQGERPRIIQCLSNIRGLLFAIQGYESNQHVFPKGTWPNPSLAPGDRLSWYVGISPYLDYQGLWDSIDRTQAWDAISNSRVASLHLGLKCPSAAPSAVSPPSGLAPTSYIGIAGLGMDAPLLPTSDPRAGVFGYDRQTTRTDIKDGFATTMLIAETGQVRDSWLAGGPATIRGLDPSRQPYLGPGRQFGGHHRGRCCIAMVDGSVRFVIDSIDPKVFEALSTIAGGETVSYGFSEDVW